jgi:hypothetical protein
MSVGRAFHLTQKGSDLSLALRSLGAICTKVLCILLSKALAEHQHAFVVPRHGSWRGRGGDGILQTCRAACDISPQNSE